MNTLQALQQHSQVVADTGDLSAIERFQPVDATTNPSLIRKAMALDAFQPLRASVAEQLRHQSPEQILDNLTVAVGCAISQRVPGWVSAEVDVRLSFDTQATIARVRQLAEGFAARGVDPAKRILFKIAATWEGIQAARILEAEGLHCNLTLLFSLPQAQACADAGVTLISPFVGRIADWYAQKEGVAGFSAEDDPGVASVRRVWNWMKAHDYATIVMAASFRNTGQILALAGCDKLTISPALLQALQDMDQAVARQLHTPQWQENSPLPDEAAFRWQVNADAMATEKLAEGMRLFAADQQALLEELSRGCLVA